jgi:hypothetical protein
LSATAQRHLCARQASLVDLGLDVVEEVLETRGINADRWGGFGETIGWHDSPDSFVDTWRGRAPDVGGRG